MTVESADDRLGMLADFGEEITWTVGVTPSTLTVLAHYGTVRTEMQDGPGVLNRRATLQCREADIPVGGAAGNSVTFRAQPATVKSIEPDGAGMASVLLEITS